MNMALCHMSTAVPSYWIRNNLKQKEIIINTTQNSVYMIHRRYHRIAKSKFKVLKTKCSFCYVNKHTFSLAILPSEQIYVQCGPLLLDFRIRMIWGVHGEEYEECRLLGYKNPVHTSQETHYVSATEPSPLMLWEIWGFHGDDCEECRLLAYKNPVRTLPETHYVSTTEPSPLMLHKILGFHGSDYEECRLLECDGVWLL
jgi:hypothetical protein